MRTSLGDHLVALRRPAALAALAAAAGGVVTASAPRLGLWDLVVRVQALDTIGAEPITSLTGAEASGATWVLCGVGVVAVLVAVLVAVDRPPTLAEPLLVGAGAAVLATVGWFLLRPPSDEVFAARPGVADLLAPEPALPTGVDLDLWVRPGAGMWLLAGAGVLLVAGALVALRRG